MGGVANLALQAIPVIASAQKTVSGFQTAGDARYAAQLDAQQKADALAFEKQKAADALALEREKIAASQKEAADQKQHAEHGAARNPVLAAAPVAGGSGEGRSGAAGGYRDPARPDRIQRRQRRGRPAEGPAQDGRPHQGKPGRRGGGTSDGSGEAVLLGLVADTDQDQQEAAATDRLRTQALAQEVPDTQKSNLLERSQLAEKQRLELFSNAY